MESENMRVLVVDDDALVREMISCMLESYGYLVDTAGDGREAYEKYVLDQAFCLIISDMEMPVMSGLDLTRRLREQGFDVPVLILTGIMDLSLAIEAMKSGACDYLLKNEDVQESIVVAVANALDKKRLKDENKSLEQMVAERTGELNASLRKVEAANRLIRQTFGRYLSEDLVDEILSYPEGTVLGGESRLLTIMMSDLRGFTAISERLPPSDVLTVINIYLKRMTEIILAHKGTIIEFIGDAILAVFGAPVQRDDDAQQAVACAIEMQNAMADVNARCRELGYPEIAQGIGINTGESVVGNIGSDKRTKYGVVGKNVNLTGRIESFTVGGQILVSETTATACGPILEKGATLEVMPKGVNRPITIYGIEGIRGDHGVTLHGAAASEPVELRLGLPVGFHVLEGKYAAKECHPGVVRRLSLKEAVIHSAIPVEPMTDLKLIMFGDDGIEVASDLYAKVVESLLPSPGAFRVNFTSLPPEARIYLERTIAGNLPQMEPN